MSGEGQIAGSNGSGIDPAVRNNFCESHQQVVINSGGPCFMCEIERLKTHLTDSRSMLKISNVAHVECCNESLALEIKVETLESELSSLRAQLEEWKSLAKDYHDGFAYVAGILARGKPADDKTHGRMLLKASTLKDRYSSLSEARKGS